MRLRQAKKIMRNVQRYPAMHWVYGSGRIMKSDAICIRHYARVNNSIKLINTISDKDPLLALKLIRYSQCGKK